MTDYIVSITDTAQDAGVVWAVGRYNATSGAPALSTLDYVTSIVRNAAAGFAQAQLQQQVSAAVDKAKAGDATMLAALATTLAQAVKL